METPNPKVTQVSEGGEESIEMVNGSSITIVGDGGEKITGSYAPCCFATARLRVPIKTHGPNGNHTEEFTPEYCAICGKKL